jgi:hypothetical protein
MRTNIFQLFCSAIFLFIIIGILTSARAYPNNPLANIDYNSKQASGGGGNSMSGTNLNSQHQNNMNSFTSNYCDYEIDGQQCLIINCNSLKHIRKFPRTLKEIIPYQLKTKQRLCSIDLSDTGIVELSAADTFEHFSVFYVNLMKINPNQTAMVMSFSNIEYIKELRFPPELNVVLFIRDSNLRAVQSKALSGNNKLEVNLINVNITIPNWFMLLETSRLKLLDLRNIQNLKEEYNTGLNQHVSLVPTTSIVDVKVHYSYLPVLDDNFIFFKILRSIEQLDLVRCSISFIKNGIFDKHAGTFKGLKYLTLAHNNINRVTEQTFSGLQNLVKLDLDENPIEYVQQNTFVGLKKLRILSMNSNSNGPNVKSLNPTGSPVWMFNIFKNNRDLKEINYKTSRLLNSYCALNTIISNIKSFNENVNGLKNNTLRLSRLNSDDDGSGGGGSAALAIYNHNPHTYKKLRLFTQEQLEAKYEIFSERNNFDLYCNVFLVCKYTMVYEENDNTELWVFDSFRACPSIVLRNYEYKCGFEQKNLECQNAQTGLYACLNIFKRCSYTRFYNFEKKIEVIESYLANALTS